MRKALPRVCCLLALMLPLAVGCVSKDGRGEVNPDTREIQPGNNDKAKWPEWFPHTVDVRVHPASRYVRERGELRLEARIELLDQFKDPIKDVGEIVIELRLLDKNGGIVLDDQGRQRGFRWAFELRNRKDLLKYWDPIARAFIFQLKIGKQDADLPQYRTVLRVTFDPAWPGLPTLPTGEKARKPVEIRTDW